MLVSNYPPRREDDIDGWFDYFQREIANYKQAIRRVIQDVIQLRDQHKILTAANSDLKTKVENFDKKKKVLYEIFEGDKIDKAKMQEIFSEIHRSILLYLIVLSLDSFRSAHSQGFIASSTNQREQCKDHQFRKGTRSSKFSS